MDGGPVDLILVRHGESEGNLAQIRSKFGVDHDWSGEFLGRHTCNYRLTDKGRKQAECAGEYIRNNIYPSFDKYYTSEYIRAMETSSLLGFEENSTEWLVEFNLREKDQGVMAGLSKKERKKEYADEIKRRERDIFYWQPPGGESIATMSNRVAQFMHVLERDCQGLRVIVVCHGNIIGAFRLILENLTQHKWGELRASKDPHDKIHNCQVFWYSRRNPHSKRIHSNLSWVRRTCPWNQEKSRDTWEHIKSPSFTTKDLAALVEEVPRIVNNDPEIDDKLEADSKKKENKPVKNFEMY